MKTFGYILGGIVIGGVLYYLYNRYGANLFRTNLGVVNASQAPSVRDEDNPSNIIIVENQSRNCSIPCPGSTQMLEGYLDQNGVCQPKKGQFCEMAPPPPANLPYNIVVQSPETLNPQAPRGTYGVAY